MKKTLITLTATLSAILIVSTGASAFGTLTPSGTAGDATQYTLNDIYTKLTTGTGTSTKTGSISVPGSVSASFNTLSEIYDAIPDWQTLSSTSTSVLAGFYDTADLSTIDTDLIAANIATGTSIFGIDGTLTIPTSRTLSSATTTVLAGSYSATDLATVDTDLAAANIVSGTSIFGINGTAVIPASQTLSAATTTVLAGSYSATDLATVDTDLAAANIVSGTSIFGINGIAVIPASQTLSAATTTVLAGSYSATNLATVDTDLTAANIATGTSIFGIVGTRTSGVIYPTEWSDTAGGGTLFSWAAAVTYCDNLNENAHTDWRLPTLIELINLHLTGVPINVLSAGEEYWSSTELPSDSNSVFIVALADASLFWDGKTLVTKQVTCTR